jgi:integrase
MLQTLLETGAGASELVQLRVEDVSLIERLITIRQGKGGKRREVPIRRDLAPDTPDILMLSYNPGYIRAPTPLTSKEPRAVVTASSRY